MLSRTKKRVVSAFAFACLSFVATNASAFEAEVTSDTAAQAYSLRSPFGDPILYRRRITQTLGLGVYNLLRDEKPGGPQLFVKLRMRLDADFGVEANERRYELGSASSRFVPGLSEAPIDLMYGYVEGRNLAGGWLGFRAGRQYVTDALGWWSFDGALVRLTPPFLHVEAYGGYEQRAGLPLSLGRFERGGVARGDRSVALEGSPDTWRNFQQAAMAPAYGFAIESAGPTWIHGRLDYRKVMNRGTVSTNALPDVNGNFGTTSGSRVSSDRLGYAIDGTAGKYGAAKAGLVYDLYNKFFSSYYASLDGYVTEKLTVSLDYDMFRPTFDGDSIFNWFTHWGMETATLRASMNVTDRLDVAASGGFRWYKTDEAPDAPSVYQQPGGSTPTADPEASSPAKLRDTLGSANLRYRWDTARVGVRALYESGDRGKREGIDLSGDKSFRGGKYFALARTSVFDWKDELRPDRSATSLGYVLGGGFQPADFARMHVEWEHNANKLVGQRYRILALLTVVATR